MAMTKNKRFLISYKLLFALLGFSAVVTEVATIVERGVFNAANFFSFFTIEGNILLSLALILGAIAVASGKKSKKLDTFRGFTVTMMIIVGIGFAVLLSGLENVALTAVPWDNIVLHYIMPVVALIDFIVDPPKAKLAFKKGLLWLLFPLIYLFYSLIRGANVGWYPYPFLNPNVSSVSAIIVASLGILMLGIISVWLVTWLSRRKS